MSEEPIHELLLENDLSQAVKLTRESPQIRAKAASSSQVWEFVTANLIEDLLPLIANLAATVQGNRLCVQHNVPSKVAELKLWDKRPFWTALSNCCQIVPLADDAEVAQHSINSVAQFPDPVLQLAAAQVRGGSLNWLPLVTRGLSFFTQWHTEQLPAADSYTRLVSQSINLNLEELFPSKDIVLYQVLDSVLYGGATPPKPLVLKVYAEFKVHCSQAASIFESRNEDDWTLFILYLEILSASIQNQPEVKEWLGPRSVAVVTQLIHECNTHLPKYNKLSTAPSQLQVQDFPMIKSTAISLLSQIIIDNKPAQDELLTCGGLALVLEACVIDANNPYMKERAIMCVRYALRDNQQNQDFVASLEQKQEVDAEALQRAGLEVEVIDGRLCLKK